MSVGKGGNKMKKLALGLILAALSPGVFAQGAETAAGGSAAGAGTAAGAGVVITTNAAFVAAGLLTAGAVAAGSKTETTTSHECSGQTRAVWLLVSRKAGWRARARLRLFHFPW
jgi:hypothetical protein